MEGLLFTLRPYINKQTNCLLNNPKETEVNKMNPLTLSEIAKLLKVRVRDVEQLLLDYEINGTPVFLISGVGLARKHKKVFVNGTFFKHNTDGELVTDVLFKMNK
jgi:hypothetical protein